MSFRFKNLSRSWALLLIACTAATQEPQGQETAAQRGVVDSLLAQNQGWRRAQSTDNTKIPELKKAGVAVPERPYFVSTSPTSDGSFAIALVKADSFRVFYVRREATQYLGPQEVTSAGWLNRGQLILRGDTLEIAPLASDEIFTFVWNEQAKAMRPVPGK